MVALRSRRLEAILGASLDELQYHHLEALVTNQISEAFDLDFKETLYGGTDKDKRDLATDVAALANTAGGVLVLGIAEDRQSRAVAAPGVAVSGAEVERILSIVGAQVVPTPVFDPLQILKPGETAHGFLVVAVPPSSLAPHAVIVNQGLRYPRRNGTTTRYLSEPEVASAYRERLAGAERQAARVEEVEQEALARLDTSDLPWVVVSLVPDSPGHMSINREVFTTFQRGIRSHPATIVSGSSFHRSSVGRRRLLADGTMDDSPRAKWVSLELHSDGSGAYGTNVRDLVQGQPGLPPPGDEARVRRVQDEGLVVAVLSGLLLLAQHARDRAMASGNALIRAQVFPISPERPTGLGQTRFYGFPDAVGGHVLTEQPLAAEAAAGLDDLAQPGSPLVEASALLVNEVGQAFGAVEMPQLTRDGKLRRSDWSQKEVISWAQLNGIEVISETIP